MRATAPTLACLVLCAAGALACGDDREPRLGVSERSLAAGELGPVATRVSPPRRRVRVMVGGNLHLDLRASDSQADLSGVDVYVDGELAAQQHVGSGQGATADFHHDWAAEVPGRHVIVAKAFDRLDHYSEGVTWIADVVPRGRALYVTHLLDEADPTSPGAGVPGLLDHPAAADALVAFVAAHGIDGVTFYQLRRVFRDGRSADLSALFGRLVGAGVRELGAPIGGTDELEAVRTFNAAHPEVAFSLVVTEDEYWLSCDEPARGYRHECARCRAQCFPPFLSLLRASRALADDEATNGRPLAVAAYLGYPSTAEAEQIASLVDRVLLNYHGADPDAAYDRSYTAWGAMRARLHAFGGGPRIAEIWPILYSCGEASMHGWLDTHGVTAAEEQLVARVSAEGAPLTDDIVIGGFAYYRYDGFGDAACP